MALTCTIIPASEVCRLCLGQAIGQAVLDKRKRPEMDEFLSKTLNFLELILGRDLPERVCDQCYNELLQISLNIKKYTHAQNVLSRVEKRLSKVQPDSTVQIQTCDGLIDTKEDSDLNCEESINDDQESALLFENKNDDENEYESVFTDSMVQEADSNSTNINEVWGEKTIKEEVTEKNENEINPNISFNTNEVLCEEVKKEVDKEICYMCHTCKLKFSFEHELIEHLKKLHQSKNHVCSICGKNFKTKQCLLDHRNIHTGTGSYKCEICHKAYIYRSGYYSHLRTHKEQSHTDMPEIEEVPTVKSEAGEVPICDVCGKKCVSMHTLKLHRISHDENRTYCCKICKQVFSSRVLLNRHSEKHDAEKIHVCNYCPKRYPERNSLRIHMRTHTGVRPFKCQVCDKTFIRKSALVYHSILHTNEKAFACKYCKKRFAFKGNLTVHMRIHTGVKPYKCHVCCEGFRDASARKRHVLSWHGEHEVQRIKIVDSNEA